MTLQEKLKQCQRDKTALLATNFYNFETLTAVLKAAKQMQSPLILQLTKSSIDYMGLKLAVAMARQRLSDYGLEGWIHLDHGNSIELVQQCLDAGFDSVMIDASEMSFIENVRKTCEVVRISKSYNANVEAELGYVAKLGQEQNGGFTTASDAALFVKQTGIDALAIAIGSAHGFYKSVPHLDIDRLKEIHQTTNVALVLHGSSGIPHEMVKEAIRNGIVKVNLATEIKDTFMRTLKQMLINSNEIDLRKVFPSAMDPVINLLCEKYKMVTTANIF
jgi:ketose-bisphosphate aldolase